MHLRNALLRTEDGRPYPPAPVLHWSRVAPRVLTPAHLQFCAYARMALKPWTESRRYTGQQGASRIPL